jgi:hypothetical protein
MFLLAIYKTHAAIQGCCDFAAPNGSPQESITTCFLYPVIVQPEKQINPVLLEHGNLFRPV